MFKIVRKSVKSKARVGIIETPHGAVKTPCFMVVGTRGVVKSLSSLDLTKLGADIMLANTYHLKLEASEILENKRLRDINNWPHAILTDSGGFQIFSLGGHRKITEEGVEFRHPLSGDKVFLTPEEALNFQHNKIGADIAMCLDVCPPSEAVELEVAEACRQTTAWAQRTLASVSSSSFLVRQSSDKLQRESISQQIFGICQGGVYENLRRAHAQEIAAMAFDGFAVGGLAVGEEGKKVFESLSWSLEYLPEDKPRYAMGVGKLEQMYEAIKMGVDMFDCVVPTREARHGRIYIWSKGDSGPFAELGLELKTIDITNADYKTNFDLICPDHPLSEVAGATYAWLNYLFKINEMLAFRLATAINIWTYLEFFKMIREKI